VVLIAYRYITEIAPSARRGTLVSMPQLMAALGVCTGYFTCYITIRLSSSFSFRTPFIIQAIFGTLLAVTCLYLPSSPRWLLLNNRREEALIALERLDIPRAEAEKDILRPVATNEQSTLKMRDCTQIFGKEYAGRTMLGLFILGMVQLCGIDGVLYVRSSHVLTFSKAKTFLSMLQ
jgi:MFS family permease